jgi:hypothetical protein
MKRSPVLICLMIIFFQASFGQAKMRKLSTSINHPSLNVFSPFMSSDGNTLVFISDNAEDNALTPFYTVRQGTDWKEPQMFPKYVHTRLNFLRGYAINSDGKNLFISTVKGPAVGGYDIWMSELKGTAWAEPKNLGMPINTKSNEACPSITTDGKTLYFMRCETMDQNSAQGCKIFQVIKKANGEWGEPLALPSNINTGNSQTPRIMADGETLIFASDKLPGNKGGMDLYLTRPTQGGWSDPIPLDFVNTGGEDQYVSATATGRYLLKDIKGARKNEIAEFLFPENVRPKALMKVDGKVLGTNATTAYVSVFDLNARKIIFNTRPFADGTFTFYLKEGSRYEVSVDPEAGNLSYYSRIFDLTSNVPQGEKITAELKEVQPGDSLDLDMVSFKPSSSELDLPLSGSQLKKLVRFMESNPARRFEINIEMEGYEEDSLQSSVDFSEIRYDTITAQYEKTDSLGQIFMADTTNVIATFHNDRTGAQARKLIDYFAAAGVDRSRLSYVTEVFPAEEKRLRVFVIVR